MKGKKTLLIFVAGIALCLAAGPPRPTSGRVEAGRLAVSVKGNHSEGGSKHYEVAPIVTLPDYTAGPDGTIDAYERLMQRYMDLTEGYLLQLGVDCRTVTRRLDSIDSRLNEISARLARIENALGIDPNGQQRTDDGGQNTDNRRGVKGKP